MRLIDADKLTITRYDYEGALTLKQRLQRLVDNQPTVKAISIEWLEGQLDVFGDGFYDLRLVIKHWEKENEINRCK